MNVNNENSTKKKKLNTIVTEDEGGEKKRRILAINFSKKSSKSFSEQPISSPVVNVQDLVRSENTLRPPIPKIITLPLSGESAVSQPVGIAEKVSNRRSTKSPAGSLNNSELKSKSNSTSSGLPFEDTPPVTPLQKTLPTQLDDLPPHVEEEDMESEGADDIEEESEDEDDRFFLGTFENGGGDVEYSEQPLFRTEEEGDLSKVQTPSSGKVDVSSSARVQNSSSASAGFTGSRVMAQTVGIEKDISTMVDQYYKQRAGNNFQLTGCQLFMNLMAFVFFKAWECTYQKSSMKSEEKTLATAAAVKTLLITLPQEARWQQFLFRHLEIDGKRGEWPPGFSDAVLALLVEKGNKAPKTKDLSVDDQVRPDGKKVRRKRKAAAQKAVDQAAANSINAEISRRASQGDFVDVLCKEWRNSITSDANPSWNNHAGVKASLDVRVPLSSGKSVTDVLWNVRKDLFFNTDEKTGRKYAGKTSCAAIRDILEESKQAAVKDENVIFMTREEAVAHYIYLRREKLISCYPREGWNTAWYPPYWLFWTLLGPAALSETKSMLAFNDVVDLTGTNTLPRNARRMEKDLKQLQVKQEGKASQQGKVVDDDADIDDGSSLSKGNKSGSRSRAPSDLTSASNQYFHTVKVEKSGEKEAVEELKQFIEDLHGRKERINHRIKKAEDAGDNAMCQQLKKQMQEIEILLEESDDHLFDLQKALYISVIYVTAS